MIMRILQVRFMYSILYVDDEPDILDITKIFLEEGGNFRVDTSNSAKKMLESSTIPTYDAIITDYQMPGMNGIQFLIEIRKQYGDIPVIIYTGKGREEIVIEALNNGADFYVQKGGEPSAQYADLGHKTLQAILRKNAERSVDNLNKIFSALPVGVLLLDEDTVITHASRSLAGMVLREPADVIGKRGGGGLGCINSEEDPKGCGYATMCPSCPLRKGLEQVIATGCSIRDAMIELTLRIDGKLCPCWLRVNAEPVSIDNARFVLVAVDDVTNLKKSQMALPAQ